MKFTVEEKEVLERLQSGAPTPAYLVAPFFQIFARFLLEQEQGSDR